MKTRKLGWTDLEITTMGMGTYALGGGDWQYGWGAQDDADSIASIKRAFELGINWIDVAPAYGLGHAEIVTGQVLKDISDDIIVATKCGLSWDENGTINMTLGGDTIQQEVEDSLKRLNVDVIDLFQIHWPIPDEGIESAWTAIGEMVKEGKIRYAGVSNFSLDQLKRAQAIHPIASLQPPYSMVERGIENGILDYCTENNIGVIVYSPMESGLLTGKFSAEHMASLPDNDWRKTANQFTEPEFSLNLELVEGLRPIAKRNGKSLPELAIAWTLTRSAITAAIVGARHPSQIEGTIGAADWQLSSDDLKDINALLQHRENALAQA
jgi:aryl-alcohol dehydrogenase-like predicted oxidoreductase